MPILRKDKGTRKKGTFSDLRLAVARNYVFPISRKQIFLIGGLGCAAFAVYFLLNALFLENSFISRGPLSSKHANFEKNCVRCHQPFGAVLSSKCSTCHEKTGDEVGVYTFAAHYLYRTLDMHRIGKSQANYSGEENPCSSCHPDHLGREARITEVPDLRCTTCHVYGSFNQGHPEFEFARMQVPDDTTLTFTHIRHTKFVFEKIQRETGSIYIEKACLYCHAPMRDGKNFMPIDYDTHCGDCHLTSASETPPLAIRDPSNPDTPGVEALNMIQSRRGPGTMWAFYTNPNEFMLRAGGRIVKSPVYHRDPWIMENLKLIRQTLYADLGLSELLQSSGTLSTARKDLLYNEAIKTLQDYVIELRARPEPEVQMDLSRIDSLLRVALRRVKRSPYSLSDSLIALKTGNDNANLTPLQRQDLEDLALKLTKPCQECHTISRAAIMRVATDQRVLHRAEFNHRAHILERRCLDCHVEIPVAEALRGDTAIAISMDRAATQNIPKIENCITCHTEEKASNRCVTCHYMHPNKENRSSLVLFVD